MQIEEKKNEERKKVGKTKVLDLSSSIISQKVYNTQVYLIFPDEFASFKGTSSSEYFLKDGFSDIWVNVTYISAFAHKQKHKLIKHKHKEILKID